MNNIGRFAPSPSGLLHFGSFITALGSYLQAKSTHCEWLVRIEDIDTLREVPGSAKNILLTLEKIGLHWDREVVYQSKRLDYYRDVLAYLLDKAMAYYCDCTRQRIQSLADSIYDNHCRSRNLAFNHPKNMSIRLRQTMPINCFTDYIRGEQSITQYQAQEDFIIRRKDGIFAYNLVVVIDDHLQGVSEIVRGADLLAVTHKQLSLYKLLGWSLPNYYHLPLALDENGNKFSKQNHAPPISLNNINQLIIDGLLFLGQLIPTNWQDANREQLLNWAVEHWDITRIPHKDSTVSNNELTTDKR